MKLSIKDLNYWMVFGAILLIAFWLLIISSIFSCNGSEEPKEIIVGEDTIHVFKAPSELSEFPEDASFEELMKFYQDLAKRNKVYEDYHAQEEFAQGVERYLNGTIDSIDLSDRIRYLNKKEKELWKIVLAHFDKTEKKEKILIMLK